MLTQSRLKELLSYDHETGIFIRISSPKSTNIGKTVGTIKNNGYIQILVDKKLYHAHRLAWLYIYGDFPINQIDHINGIRNDNKISNLRLATDSQNKQNRCIGSTNTSGFFGVDFSKSNGRYRARIRLNNKRIFLGYFGTVEEAGSAYHKAKRELHEFNPIQRGSESA